MGAVEEAMEPGEGVALGLLVGVCVDLQRHGQPGVAEDDLGVASRHAQVLQERGDRMPDMMNRDHANGVLGVVSTTGKPGGGELGCGPRLIRSRRVSRRQEAMPPGWQIGYSVMLARVNRSAARHGHRAGGR